MGKTCENPSCANYNTLRMDMENFCLLCGNLLSTSKRCACGETIKDLDNFCAQCGRQINRNTLEDNDGLG